MPGLPNDTPDEATYEGLRNTYGCGLFLTKFVIKGPIKGRWKWLRGRAAYSARRIYKYRFGTNCRKLGVRFAEECLAGTRAVIILSFAASKGSPRCFRIMET